MKTILLTACPGRDEPLVPWPHKSPVSCSVHGFGAAVGADIWEGWRSSGEMLRALPEYDVVVVNGNTPLLSVVAEIAGSGPRVVLLQEGDARVWDTISPDDLVSWLVAAEAADLCLTYDDVMADTWRSLSGGTPVAVIPLPHPHAEWMRRLRWSKRDHAVFVSSGLLSRRGGLRGTAFAREATTTAEVLVPDKHYDAGERHDQLDCVARAYGVTLVPWCGYREFFGRLSRCRLAINLDPVHGYGRFAADCAAAGVPCVGLSHQPAQRSYWPGLCNVGTDEAAIVLADPERCAEYLARADAEAARRTPANVREVFEAAVEAVL